MSHIKNTLCYNTSHIYFRRILVMNEETKARSFRITEETAEKFKSLCTAFPNQNAALESLIQAYEIQSATAVLTDRQADISDYSSHIQALQSAFIHSLELNENAESRIRSEFQKQLASKDMTIQDLQERVKVLEQMVQTAQEQATAAENEMSALSEQNAELIDSLSQKVQSAEKRADEMTESAATAKALASSLQEQLDSAKKSASEKENLEVRLATAEQEKHDAETCADDLARQLEQERKSAQQDSALAEKYAEVEKEKAVLAEREKSTAKIQELTEKISQLYEKISAQGEQIQQLTGELSQMKLHDEKNSKSQKNQGQS